MAKKVTNALSYENIVQAVRAGDFKPIYYLMGEESYYIDRLTDIITDAALRPEERDFDMLTLFGPETDTQTVVQAALAFPIAAERQVVVVREAQDLKDIDQLETYLKQPQPQTILIICHKNGTLDKRRSVAKLIEKVGVLYNSEGLSENRLPGWVRDYLKQKKVGIEARAELMMAEYVGSDLNRMAGELDKLALSLPADRRVVSTADVADLIGVSKEFNTFELTDALARKDVIKVRQITNYFDKTSKRNPIQKILPVVFKFFQTLFLAYYAPDKSPDGLASWLGIHPYPAKITYLPAMRLYSGRKVMEIIGQIRRTDAKSKGVDCPATSDGELFKELMFFILH